MLGPNCQYYDGTWIGRGREGVLFSLEALSLILLQAHDTATLQEAIVDEMVRLRGHHTLDVVLEIAQHNAEPLRGAARASVLGVESLDLETLKNWDGELLLGPIAVIEHGAVPKKSESGIWHDGGIREETYSRAPCVIWPAIFV